MNLLVISFIKVTQSLTPSFICSFRNSFIKSFWVLHSDKHVHKVHTCTVVHSFIYLFILSLTPSLPHLLTHSVTHTFNPLPITSFIRSFRNAHSLIFLTYPFRHLYESIQVHWTWTVNIQKYRKFFHSSLIHFHSATHSFILSITHSSITFETFHWVFFWNYSLFYLLFQ
jgi:hypothetical protein